jgi:hypothetical protein
MEGTRSSPIPADRPKICKRLFLATDDTSSSSSAPSRTPSAPPPPSSQPVPDDDNDDGGTTPTFDSLTSSMYYRYLLYRDFVDDVSHVIRDMSPDGLLRRLRFPTRTYYRMAMVTRMSNSSLS